MPLYHTQGTYPYTLENHSTTITCTLIIKTKEMYKYDFVIYIILLQAYNNWIKLMVDEVGMAVQKSVQTIVVG